MKDFRDLKVWEKAHQLVKGLYQATGHFPTEGEVRLDGSDAPSGGFHPGEYC